MGCRAAPSPTGPPAVPTFSYEAIDEGGKIANGVLEARSEEAAVQALRGRKMLPLKVLPLEETKGLLEKEVSVKDFLQRVRRRDVTTFTHQLATLVDSGLPLDRALGILIDLQDNQKFKAILLDIRRSVQGGNSLADALAKHPHLFNRLYINMVRAGETGGVLELIFTRLAEFLERAQEMRDTMVSAMVYPLILTSIGGISVLILVAVVLPKFEAIFERLGEGLPLSTAMLVAVSTFVRSYWYIAAGIIAAVVLSFRAWVQTPQGRKSWDGMKLALPLAGDLIRKVEVARFARTMGTLINSGVPILQALSIVKETLTNDVISGSLIAVYGGIKEGEGISGPLKDAGVFPPLAIHMIRVGEETGRLEAMLNKVADTYEYEVRSTAKRMLALLEPIMIVVMGLMVGFIVASIMQAIFKFSTMAGGGT
jgi:general secretion pathway protein F